MSPADPDERAAMHAFFEQMDYVLEALAIHAGKFAVNGPMTDEQTSIATFMVNTTDELRAVFQREAIRQKFCLKEGE